MKKGDMLPVVVEGVHITNAVVEAVDAEKGRIHLLIPGTRAVVSFRMSLTDAPSEPPAKETIVDEVVRPDNSSEPATEQVAAPTADSSAAGEQAEPAATETVEPTADVVEVESGGTE